MVGILPPVVLCDVCPQHEANGGTSSKRRAYDSLRKRKLFLGNLIIQQCKRNWKHSHPQSLYCTYKDKFIQAGCKTTKRDSNSIYRCQNKENLLLAINIGQPSKYRGRNCTRNNVSSDDP
jgi:hypothetical protein